MPHFSDVHIITVEQSASWISTLSGMAYDFYHLPSYHQLNAQQGEAARLFVYQEGEYRIALPLVLRSLRTQEPLFRDNQFTDYYDATSVYGYAGPVASHREIPDRVLQDFRAAITTKLRELKVVSLFSRLHPLIPQIAWLTGLGECRSLGQTVSIDLTESIETQWGHYRKVHRYEIRRLRNQGVECIHDAQKRYLPEFIEIYHETMRRVQAQNLYFFSEEYFEHLMSESEGNVELFVTLAEGQVVSAALFLVCNDIVQYHLAGTRQEWTKLAPMKLIIDTVRQWAVAQGKSVFHLGGGVGSQEDSLFAFKAGFSPHRHTFSVWQWIPLPEIYAQICASHIYWQKQQGLKPKSLDFFPAYRVPLVSTNQT